MSENRWDYKVAVKDIEAVDDRKQLVRTRRCTIDETTGEVIGLVSNNYRPIQNKTLYDVMQNVGDGLGLALKNVFICRNRATTIFKYGFGEKHQVAIEGSQTKDDIVRFGVEVVNSFDTTGIVPSSGIRFVAERLVCLNGMHLLKSIGRISFRDLGDFSEEGFKRTIGNRVATVVGQASIWNQWAKITPDRAKVQAYVLSNFGKKISGDLLHKYFEGQDKSLWGFYNLITAYITHALEVRNPENTRLSQIALAKVETGFYTEDFK